MPAAQAAAETGDSRLSGLDWDLVRVGRQAGLAVLFPAMRQGRQAMRFRHEVTWFLDEAIDMLDRAERLQRQFFHPAQFGQPRANWASCFSAMQRLRRQTSRNCTRSAPPPA